MRTKTKAFSALLWALSLGVCAAQQPPSGTAHTKTPTAALMKHIDALRAQGRIEEFAAEMEKIGAHLMPAGKQMMYQEYADTQFGAGHLKAAAEAYQKAIRAAPKSSTVGFIHYTLGSLRAKQHDYTEAVTEYQAAVESPHYTMAAWTYLLMGDYLHKLGRDTEAHAAWTRATAANDDDASSKDTARARLKRPDSGSSFVQ